MLFLIPSSSIVHSYGCVIGALITKKLADLLKEASGLLITINRVPEKESSVSIRESRIQILATAM